MTTHFCLTQPCRACFPEALPTRPIRWLEVPVEVRDSAGGTERVLADEDDDTDWGPAK